MPFFYLDYYYLILVVPTLIFAIFTQIWLKNTYKKYSGLRNARGLTGADAAMNVLRHYQIYDVKIEHISGRMTDHYDPRTKVIRLSEGVYNGTSIAAVGIACHEAGHAAQHANGYVPIKIRNAIIPICNIGSMAGIPLAIIGLFLSSELLINVGLLLYSFVAIFQLATLPVEFNASARAISVIKDSGMLMADEVPGARKMLTAAAMTYVAALATSLANLLRLLLIFGRRND